MAESVSWENLRFVKWVKTDDKKGFKPTFKITCEECGKEMFLRNSELTLDQANSFGRNKVVPILRVMYKCIPCAEVKWFYIGPPQGMDNDYWNELLKRRDNHPLYVPPVEEWSDDIRVQKRLKALGYVGGDIDEYIITELEE